MENGKTGMKKSKRLWVVDLGEKTTKIALGAPDENRVMVVENYWIGATPQEVFREGTPENKIEFGAFLREHFKDRRRTDELMLVLSHRTMVLAPFTLPMMDEEEVEKAIHWKMQVIIPERIKDWRIDFLARERIDVFEYLGVDDKRLDILGIGVPKAVLLNYCRVFKGAKQRIEIIEPQFHGLGRLLKTHSGQSSLIIDLGFTSTRLLSYAHGFLQEERRIEIIKSKDLKAFLTPIVNGILESFQSPLSLARGFENEAVFLMGGGLVPGVADYLSGAINREVKELSIQGRDPLLFKFQKEISKEELCLLMPCLGGMLGWRT